MNRHSTTLLQRVHRTQRLRHFAANKLTLSLLVLRDLQAGRPASDRSLRLAIRDLEGAIRLLEASSKPRGQRRASAPSSSA